MAVGNIRQPEFGQRLRRLREQRELSQRDVAGDAVNPSYISLLESGARVPTLEVVMQLAHKLEVPLQQLVDGAVLAPDEQGDRGGRLVLDILARSSLDFGDLDEAENRFRRAYHSARDEGQVMSAVEYGFSLQEILNLRGDEEARYAHLAELDEIAQQSQVREVLVKVAIDRAAAARDIGQMREASEFAERAAETIEGTSLGYTSEHVRMLGVLISIRCETGDIVDVPQLIDRMIDIAEKADSRPVIGRAHWAASVAFARIGESHKAERHVRYAKDMLATPATPLWEWARFCRAAASALLDAEAEVVEVEQFVRGAHAALSMLQMPKDTAHLRVLEARYALASGSPEKALELSDERPEGLPNLEIIRLRMTRGRALCQLGRVEDGVVELRAAARLCEELELFRIAAQAWREIDDARSR